MVFSLTAEYDSLMYPTFQILKQIRQAMRMVNRKNTLKVIPGLSAIRFVDLPEELLSPEPIILFDNLRNDLLPHADAVVLNSMRK